MPETSQTPSAHTFPIPEIIPIFPLPTVVFFPQTFLPLHIFEPRYRDMLTKATQKGKCIGMTLLQDGWEEHYYENPPIAPLGCVGRLVSIHQLEDGRSNIVLEGLHRFTIQEEFHDHTFRQARVALKPVDPSSSIDPMIRSTLVSKAQQYLCTKNAEDLCRMMNNSELTDGVLVNSLSSCLDFTSVEKQFLLESESLLQQARRLIDLLLFKLQASAESPGWG
jgi:Lon protease-like protein